MSTGGILQSWKEISAHVGRTERTLQRWERGFGFPVHRPAGKPRSAVAAVVSEIERWMAATPALHDMRQTAKPGIPPAQSGSDLDPGEALALSNRRYGDPTGLAPCQVRLAAIVQEHSILCSNMRDLIAEQRKLREEHRLRRGELHDRMHALASG